MHFLETKRPTQTRQLAIKYIQDKDNNSIIFYQDMHVLETKRPSQNQQHTQRRQQTKTHRTRNINVSLRTR